MTFFNLRGLWFLTALAPLVVLYLLKVKRDRRTVSSTLLWTKILSDLSANAPFQKLKKNLLLLLQILIIAGLAFVIARPIITGKSTPSAKTVIIIDNSGSMNVVEGGKNRLESAKDEALKLLRSVNPGRRNEFMLITFNNEARTLSSFTDDIADLSRKVRAIQSTELGTDVFDALIVSESAVKGHTDATVYLITDGCFDESLPDLEGLSKKLMMIQVGSVRHNVAITNLAVESLGREDAYEVYASLRNYSDKEAKVIMSVYDGDLLVDAREIVIEPFGRSGRSFISVPTGSVLRCVIDNEDALSEDNTAYAVFGKDNDISILLVTAGNVFLTRALASLDSGNISTVAPSGYNHSVTYNFDVIIFDGWMPEKIPAKMCAFISPPPDSGLVNFDGLLESVMITDYRNDDPLFRFVSIRDLFISKAMKVSSSENVSAIASSRGEPLIARFIHDSIEHVILCFDINASEWPARPSFPIFVSNLVETIALSNKMISSVNIKTGTAVEVNRSSPDQPLSVIMPDGKSIRLNEGERQIKFFDTSLSGIYMFRTGDKELPVAVNFFDEIESDTFSQRELAKELPGGSVSATVSSVNREIWKWFALGVLLLSIIEWVCFHRKIQ